MKPAVRILLFTGLGIAAAAFGYKMYQQVMIAMQYCWRVSGISIKRFSKSLIEFDLLIRFLNKSTLQATITGFNLDIYLNSKKIANVSKQTSILVQKSGVTSFTLPVSINPSTKFTFDEVIELAANYLTKAGQEKIKIRVVGTMDVKAYGVSKKNIDIDVTMSVKELLETDPNAPICPDKF